MSGKYISNKSSAFSLSLLENKLCKLTNISVNAKPVIIPSAPLSSSWGTYKPPLPTKTLYFLFK